MAEENLRKQGDFSYLCNCFVLEDGRNGASVYKANDRLENHGTYEVFIIEMFFVGLRTELMNRAYDVEFHLGAANLAYYNRVANA
ncbi:MAG: hypothetical protein ON057_000155 [Glomeribacter sp. 1016415]|nr:hypothetical protein [Glomeribacter sp. 1016415]